MQDVSRCAYTLDQGEPRKETTPENKSILPARSCHANPGAGDNHPSVNSDVAQ